jgi:hypothetical protein
MVLVVLRTTCLRYQFPVALVNCMFNAKWFLITFGMTDDTEFFSMRKLIGCSFSLELLMYQTPE